MQILLANAKMMLCSTEAAAKPLTVPAFQAEADRLAKEMARLNLDELAAQLGCSRQLALENQQRYQNFFSRKDARHNGLQRARLSSADGAHARCGRPVLCAGTFVHHLLPLRPVATDGCYRAVQNGAYSALGSNK